MGQRGGRVSEVVEGVQQADQVEAVGRVAGRVERLKPDAAAEAGLAGLSPGGTRAILEMYRARQTDAEQNRPHYADPISCPVLAVGAQAYLGDEVSNQLAQVARDVRGAVIPASGHNVALENPAALAQAYLDFFAGG